MGPRQNAPSRRVGGAAIAEKEFVLIIRLALIDLCKVFAFGIGASVVFSVHVCIC